MALTFLDDDNPNYTNKTEGNMEESTSDELLDVNLNDILQQEEENENNNNDEKVEENLTQEDIITQETTLNNLTEKEKEQSNKLQDTFSIFLKNNFEIEESKYSKKTISTGIDLLDTILGGGVGMGFVQFVGPPGSGKSALVSKIIATGQKKYPGKFISIYADSEVSMSTERLAQLGVKNPKIKPYTDITVEKVFKFVEALCVFKEKNPDYLEYPSVIVWDSLANTMTEKGMETEDMNSVMGEKARILSHLIPRYVKKLEQYNISLVTINQLRDKIDIGIFKKPNDLRWMGDKNIPGGDSTKFNSFQLFYVRPLSDLKGEYGFAGTKVMGRAVKNKLFSPNIEINMIFSFKNGFSNFFTNYELLKTFKRVKAASWCSLVNLPEVKFRQNELVKTYKTNPKFKELFDQEVKDVLKSEFIDKHSGVIDSNDI